MDTKASPIEIPPNVEKGVKCDKRPTERFWPCNATEVRLSAGGAMYSWWVDVSGCHVQYRRVSSAKQ